MTEYLDRDDVLTAGAAAVGHALTIPTLLARNHALVDGDKRTAWVAAWTFLYINGIELDDFDVDDAEVFMNDVAAKGSLTIEYIAGKLSAYPHARS